MVDVLKGVLLDEVGRSMEYKLNSTNNLINSLVNKINPKSKTIRKRKRTRTSSKARLRKDGYSNSVKSKGGKRSKKKRSTSCKELSKRVRKLEKKTKNDDSTYQIIFQQPIKLIPSITPSTTWIFEIPCQAPGYIDSKLSNFYGVDLTTGSNEIKIINLYTKFQIKNCMTTNTHIEYCFVETRSDEVDDYIDVWRQTYIDRFSQTPPLKLTANNASSTSANIPIRCELTSAFYGGHGIKAACSGNRWSTSRTNWKGVSKTYKVVLGPGSSIDLSTKMRNALFKVDDYNTATSQSRMPPFTRRLIIKTRGELSHSTETNKNLVGYAFGGCSVMMHRYFTISVNDGLGREETLFETEVNPLNHLPRVADRQEPKITVSTEI